jgi:hypothetical protein
MNYSLILPPDFKQVPLLHKNLWTDDLRSGNFRQGHNWLCRQENDGICAYCCLGVLAKLEKMHETPRKNNPKLTRFDDNAAGLTERIPQYETMSEYGKLPTGVQVDFTSLEGNRVKAENLSELNDAGFSFIEIADIIDVCFTNID